MSIAIVSLLCWVTVFARSSGAVDQGCSFDENLIPGQVYYVYSPGYPNRYTGRHSCQWKTSSDNRIKLTCNYFNLPPSYNCRGDHVAVQIDEKTTQRYCGNRNFTVESEGNEMIITLSTYYPFFSSGKFLCVLEALESDENQSTESNDNDNIDCECGWKKPTRIVGGTDAGVNEFPPMAGIVRSGEGLRCGGTIISDHYVLTAAHCLSGISAQELGVVVGEHNITTGADTNATVLHRVAKYYTHPQYTERIGTLGDIAIVQTASRIIFNSDVGPACLPFQHSLDSFGGDNVTALGWGTLEFAGPKSDTLQKVGLNVLNLAQCKKAYPEVTNNHLCTFGDHKDACQFDSGGPIMWKNPTSGRLLHIGIIAYGRGCGTDPGVNTRVGAYMDWILSQTPDAARDYCRAE